MEQEQLLYSKIKDGDEGAFNEAFNLYYPRLCYFADNMIRDFDLARSIVQDVFVDLWIKRENIDILFSLKAFLFKAVKNKSLDVIKHRKTESDFLSKLKEKNEAVVFRDLIEEAELNDKINSAIRELPERCREIFTLCRFEGLKYSEIALQLNISVKTVEMQISIALKRIRKSLSDSQMINLIVFILSKQY